MSQSGTRTGTKEQLTSAFDHGLAGASVLWPVDDGTVYGVQTLRDMKQ